jgi:hypothetical protein
MRVVVAAIAELLANPAANLKVEVGRYRHVAAVEQGMQV